jgi:uncharacterized protein
MPARGGSRAVSRAPGFAALLTLLGLGQACAATTGTVGAGAVGAAVTFGHYAPAKQYHEHVSDELYLPMRDGVRLAVRIDRPANASGAVPGRFPVIWQAGLSVARSRPPAAAGLMDVPSLTDYGYVVVQVARRGNGQSFGSRRGYNDRTEAEDAYEVTEWLAAQPWSNGSIGVYGCSNTGDAAMHAVTIRPPHLKAAFAGCFSWSKYDAMHRGGIFAQWGTGPQRSVAEDMSVEPLDADGDRKLLRQAADEHQRSTNLYEMWREMPYRDSWSALVGSRFWAEGSIASYADQLRASGVAVYIGGGWHDELRDQGIVALLNLPGARILIGPWKHCQNGSFELLQEIHRFFDTYLRGIDTGLAAEPRIHYYTISGEGTVSGEGVRSGRGAAPGEGAGEWHAVASWPVEGLRPQRWYLSERNALSKTAPAHPVKRTFRVNTAITCPQGGVGPMMQPCHLPGEGLSFASSPLRAPLEVTGNAVAALQISADRSDANVFAYLEDVAPNGQVQVITEGRLKASLRALSEPPYRVPGTPWHRSYAGDAQPLEAGQRATLQFDLMPTSYVLPAGHRVQLTITGADYRERDRDPQVAGMRIDVSSGSGYLSYIELPTPDS